MMSGMTDFLKSDTGKDVIGGATGAVGAIGGLNLTQSTGQGNVNQADATASDLLNSEAGGAFVDAQNRRKKGAAAYSAIQKGVNAIPVYGQLASLAMGIGKGVKDMFTKEDEFGITKGQYRRNADLRRGKETFFAGKDAAKQRDFDIMGAQIQSSMPSYQPPAFGRRGLKFKTKFNTL